MVCQIYLMKHSWPEQDNVLIVHSHHQDFPDVRILREHLARRTTSLERCELELLIEASQIYIGVGYTSIHSLYGPVDFITSALCMHMLNSIHVTESTRSDAYVQCIDPRCDLVPDPQRFYASLSAGVSDFTLRHL